jgi:tagatose 6-phosphate kinase
MIHVVCPNPALDRTIFLRGLELNGVSRAEFSKDLLGGKGFNVIRSYMVEKKRPDFHIHTLLGGYTGQYLQTLIQKCKVNCSVTNIKGTTRICSIIMDQNKQHAHLINENGPVIEVDEKKRFLDQLINNVSVGDFVLFSGSLPEGLGQDFYAVAIEALEKKGVKCVLDSSGVALAEGVKANPWMIKVNELEFFELIQQELKQDNPDSVEEALRTLNNSSNFIVTLGGKGTIAKYENTIYKVDLPKIEVKNATASGDIFLGCLTMYLKNNQSIENALQNASAYSLSNCLYWYPNIDLTDVEQYKSQIIVSKLGGL